MFVMRRLFQNALFAIKQFVYPSRCALCDRFLQEDPTIRVCGGCEASLKRLESDFNSVHLSTTWFDRARSVFPFEGGIRDALHGLKYEQRFDVINVLSGFLSQEARCMEHCDLIMPIPLHKRRLRTRGYNQAALLARPLAKGLGCALDVRSLVRTKDIGSQVGRELDERLEMVKGIFTVTDTDKIKGTSILLIDDVITTGATVNECARVLKKAGARSVNVLTVARTL